MENQVSPAQVEIWLDNPVTKTYLHSLSLAKDEINDTLNDGSFLDPHNNDLTCNNISGTLGEKRGYASAEDAEGLMEYFKLITVEVIAA